MSVHGKYMALFAPRRPQDVDPGELKKNAINDVAAYQVWLPRPQFLYSGTSSRLASRPIVPSSGNRDQLGIQTYGKLRREAVVSRGEHKFERLPSLEFRLPVEEVVSSGDGLSEFRRCLNLTVFSVTQRRR